MGYKNPKDLLLDATKFPAAIEAKLPEGAPKISTTLADIAGKLPLPDLPVEIPDLPAPPAIPEMPAPPAGLRRYVTGVEVTPARAAVRAAAPVAPPVAPPAPSRPRVRFLY